LARPLTYKEDEILKLFWDTQLENPALSEGAICGKLHVGREYLADRAKDSQEIRSLRSKMAAVRQAAWEEAGLKMISTPNAACTAVAFIWMSRNILGWRNDPEAVALEDDSKKPSGLTLKYSVTDPEQKP
jgi:hypothetical protein